MIVVTDKLSTETFHAFIDEQLTDEQFEQVEQLLDDIPEKIEEIQQCQIINERLREVFDPVVQEPMPDDLYELALNGNAPEANLDDEYGADYVENLDGLTDYNAQALPDQNEDFGLFDDNNGLDYEFDNDAGESDSGVLQEDTDEFADIEALGADDGLEDFDIDAFESQKEEFGSFPDIFDESAEQNQDAPESYKPVTQSPMGEAALKSMEKLQLDSVGIEDIGENEPDYEPKRFSGRRRLKDRRNKSRAKQKQDDGQQAVADLLTENLDLQLFDEGIDDQTAIHQSVGQGQVEQAEETLDAMEQVRAVQIDRKQSDVIDALATEQPLELEPIEVKHGNKNVAVKVNEVAETPGASSNAGAQEEIRKGGNASEEDKLLEDTAAFDENTVTPENIQPESPVIEGSANQASQKSSPKQKARSRKNLKQNARLKTRRGSAQVNSKASKAASQQTPLPPDKQQDKEPAVQAKAEQPVSSEQKTSQPEVAAAARQASGVSANNNFTLSPEPSELEDTAKPQGDMQSFDEIPNKEAVLDYLDELSVDQKNPEPGAGMFGAEELEKDFEVHEVVKQFEQTAGHTPHAEYQEYEMGSAPSVFGGSIDQIKDQLLNRVDGFKAKAGEFVSTFSTRLKDKLNKNQDTQYFDDFDQFQQADTMQGHGFTDQVQSHQDLPFQTDELAQQGDALEVQGGGADSQPENVPPSIDAMKFPKTKEQLLEEVENFQFASVRNTPADKEQQKNRKSIKPNESLEQVESFQFSSDSGQAADVIDTQAQPPELLNGIDESAFQSPGDYNNNQVSEFEDLEMPDTGQMQPDFLLQDSPGLLDKIKTGVMGYVEQFKQRQHQMAPQLDPMELEPQQQYTRKSLPPVIENIRHTISSKLQGIAPENRSTIGGMVLMVLGLVVGGAFVSLFGSGSTEISEATIDQIAIDTHMLYNQQDQNFVGGTGASTSETLQWLSARIGSPITLADVQVSDFKYQKAIIVPTVYNYAAANIYVNKRKQSITLFVSASIEDIQSAPLTCRIPGKVDGLCSWVSNSIRYTAIANLSLSRVRAFASEVMSKTQ